MALTYLTVDSSHVSALLLAGNPQYKLAYAYLEFANLAKAGDPITIPGKAIAAGSGKSYYAGLEGNASGVDFIRVPLAVPAAPTESDVAHVLPLVASSGEETVGHWGHAFSAANNSTVYGMALVVSPTGDFASDIVIARSYPDVSVAKAVNVAAIFTWSLGFTKPTA